MRSLINLRPTRGAWLALGLLPCVCLVIAYVMASAVRLAANPHDKLLPAPAAFADAIERFAIQPNARDGKIQLWTDTAASLRSRWRA